MIESGTAEVEFGRGEKEGNAKCGGMKVTRRACHRDSRSDAIRKDWIYRNCRSRRDVLRLWRSDTHGCVAEMQMRKM